MKSYRLQFIPKILYSALKDHTLTLLSNCIGYFSHICRKILYMNQVPLIKGSPLDAEGVVFFVPSILGQEEALLGTKIEGGEGGRVRVKDTPYFSTRVGYGDEIIVEKRSDGTLKFIQTIKASRWNAFVVHLTSTNQLSKFLECIDQKHPHCTESKMTLHTDGSPLLAMAVMRENSRAVGKTIDDMKRQGIVSDAAWTIIR